MADYEEIARNVVASGFKEDIETNINYFRQMKNSSLHAGDKSVVKGLQILLEGYEKAWR